MQAGQTFEPWLVAGFWLVGLLVGWVAGWFVDTNDGWVAGWVAGWLVDTPNRAFISVYIIRCHLLSYLRAVIFAKLS